RDGGRRGRGRARGGVRGTARLLRGGGRAHRSAGVGGDEEFFTQRGSFPCVTRGTMIGAATVDTTIRLRAASERSFPSQGDRSEAQHLTTRDRRRDPARNQQHG